MLITGASEVTTSQVTCEGFEERTLQENSQISCLMDYSTTINSHGFTISSTSDDSVGGLVFEGNKKITFLPIDVYKIFPNIIIFDAFECSIKSITRANFINLQKLKKLHLGRNQIVKITSDPFFGLESLEYVSLSKETFCDNNSRCHESN